MYLSYSTVYRLIVTIVIICLLCEVTLTDAKRCRKKGNYKDKQCITKRPKKNRDKKGKEVAPYWKKGPPSEHRLIGREGREVKLSCVIRGSPKPDFSWELNGRPLPKDKSKYKPRRGKLVVKSLTMDDIASYTCIAKNKHGSLNFTYFVSVLDNIPPKDIDVVVKPKNQTAQVGDTVMFQCRSEDWPRPSLHWARTLDTLPAMEILQRAENSPELVLHNVSKKDAGVYTCFIGRDTNLLQKLEARLTVIEEGESLPFEPKCTLHVRRQILEDHQTGCKTTEPVDVHYCMGSCGRSYYVPQLGNINQTCSCCVGVRDKLRLVTLQCPLRTTRGFYLVLRGCECRPCTVTENSGAEPTSLLTTDTP